MRQLGGFFAEIDPAEWTRALSITDKDQPLPYNFGSFLVRSDEHTILIDTGHGARARGQFEGGGKLLERLRELGVDAGDVDTVLQTHLHGDHCGWSVNDDADGALTFSNATMCGSARRSWTTGQARNPRAIRRWSTSAPAFSPW